MKTYIWVITSNHLPIWHLMAQAVCRLIGIDRHIQNIWRLHRQESVTQIWAGSQTSYLHISIQDFSSLIKTTSCDLTEPTAQNYLFFIFFFLGESSSEPFLPLPLEPRFSLSPRDSPSVEKLYIDLKGTMHIDTHQLFHSFFWKLTFHSSSICTFIAAHFQFFL